MNPNEQSEVNTNPAEDSDYQDEKNSKKQKIVRNEFETVGKYGIPLVKKQELDLTQLKAWSYTKTKRNDEENKDKIIHFFTYDWLFETVYANPEKALEKLDQYYALMTPEFSTYKNMPLTLQAYSTFKNRWCGAFWQYHGMKVIPTIAWGTPASYEFCFDGVEQNAVVAVSTYYHEDNKTGFMAGYNKMLEALNPAAIVCYGKPFDEMEGNIIELNPYDEWYNGKGVE